MPHAGWNAARLWGLAAAGIERRLAPGRNPSAQARRLAGPLRFERVVYKNRVLAFRARREQRHRAADQLLDAAHVLDGLGRQIRPGASAGGRFPPTLDRLVHRFEPGLGPLARRKIVDFAAVQAVADADLDPVESI